MSLKQKLSKIKMMKALGENKIGNITKEEVEISKKLRAHLKKN